MRNWHVAAALGLAAPFALPLAMSAGDSLRLAGVVPGQAWAQQQPQPGLNPSVPNTGRRQPTPASTAGAQPPDAAKQDGGTTRKPIGSEKDNARVDKLTGSICSNCGN